MIWIIFITVSLLSVFVQNKLDSVFARYSKVATFNSMSGADVARKFLAENGIRDVKVKCIGGHLTDHYNPETKVINLSEDVYNGCNVSAAAVAAHETGHAIQHATGYAPVKLRSALVPVVNFASNVVQWVLLAGVILAETIPGILWAGIALFAMTTFFSLVTLPVELDASRRAVEWLGHGSMVVGFEDVDKAQTALKWAAYTYVIAAVSSLATLLYYIGLARGRD